MISKHEGDIDLSWGEINDILDLDYSPCHTRKLSYGVVLYHNLLKNNKIHEDVSDDTSEKLIEIRKERVKLNDLRNEINRQVRSQARFEDMISAMTYSINQLNNIEL